MTSAPVILVTAGSAGLCAAVARAFAQRGFRVVINYNTNTERAKILCAELNRLNGERDFVDGETISHITIQADLASPIDIRRLVQETYSTMGRIDVVFSNSGWTRFSDTTSLKDNVVEDDWDRAFNMNVKSHLRLLHASKQYLDKTEGAFVTTSSIAGVYGIGSSLVSIQYYRITMAEIMTSLSGLCRY